MTKNQNNQPSRRGGARIGAGRKPGVSIKSPEDKAVTVSLSMSGELYRQLKECAESSDRSVNDAIRETIVICIKKKLLKK